MQADRSARRERSGARSALYDPIFLAIVVKTHSKKEAKDWAKSLSGQSEWEARMHKSKPS
eukprot:scaffold71237_cov30-Tisochrysis_lutea.AAC.3